MANAITNLPYIILSKTKLSLVIYDYHVIATLPSTELLRRQPFVSGDDGVALCRCGASSRVAVDSHSGVAVSVPNNADEGGWCYN